MIAPLSELRTHPPAFRGLIGHVRGISDSATLRAARSLPLPGLPAGTPRASRTGAGTAASPAGPTGRHFVPAVSRCVRPLGPHARRPASRPDRGP